MSLKRKHSQDEDATTPTIFRSAPIEDRQSTFVGYFFPATTKKPKELQQLEEFASASHKVIGWRRESNQQSITKAKQYVLGNDDDGEKYAGKKVEKVLDAMRVEGSCVVARWYGGVMLGPVRFSHIETVAKEAVRSWQDYEAEAKSKKRRLEEEAAEHTRLCKSLAERDQSVDVLRDLAAKKELEVKQHEGDAEEPSETPTSSAANKTVADYTIMTIERLRALDKARDATITFLLKRIDKAEAELKAREKPTGDPS
ncbi:IMPACT family member [Fulvia fulva]|uniref:IMPACT family member n=1 Tax=Passalora fulva TaxID=5499 RepID=A0A9Q8L729_PASFU|nr:IMPACT family member [Fulvia fulva]KAK4636310.1 IMPACT family member [Fulvia fulva]KAK4637857.1 IMPACT family member [Fulvia fulva]UJO12010.1 IMPACT family member [Fulvia fulva]WPV09785.1 IMPACT family member [Fulvia fulva]WPV24434.1 IMPACT family member [Fulvia fulva]